MYHGIDKPAKPHKRRHQHGEESKHGNKQKKKKKHVSQHQILDMFNKIAGRLDQMDTRIEEVNAKVEGGVIVGGTGEDGRGSQADVSSSHHQQQDRRRQGLNE